MSTVYRGHDVRLDRPVALKVMDYLRRRPAVPDRFQREARAVARLKNPWLVAIYDQGGDAGHPFLVIELVEGGTLRELLRERGPMPPHAALAVPCARCWAGSAKPTGPGWCTATSNPENVLISDGGEVEACRLRPGARHRRAGITSTSVILGTAILPLA